MTRKRWPTRYLSVAKLLLDEKNPRLGTGTTGQTQREIIQYLFDHDKVLEIVRSIVTRGYFENEPLLAISEQDDYVVVEGNRRLAALKAIRKPELLTGKVSGQVRNLVVDAGIEVISSVPVTVAPSRRAADRIIAGRHIGTPVLAWQAENRASFILSKLEEGYDNDQIESELGFDKQDIQKARQTRAIANVVRTIDLSAEVKSKVDDPRAKLFSTLERVFDSQVGQGFLKIEPDADHGFRGTTTKKEFTRALEHLVTDIALKKETSRSLNKNDDIRDYFENRNPQSVAQKKRGKFVPEDIITGKSTPPPDPQKPRTRRTKKISQTVIPKNFKVTVGNDRLIEIRRELTQLKREIFPNAGAVLLRVFLELSIKDYLERTGLLEKLVKRLESKGDLPSTGEPNMRQMAKEIVAVAKKRLKRADGIKVEKALRHDPAAPFSINDLHAFVHNTEFPTEKDILQFWNRTEPLFRMMLEESPEDNT